ncbi:hypothetical protein CC86DRAFT_412911 [Ophiobolus disseminans]|uniref:2EXR domain-containing protein n=1 Tax=Ophiobolus disseminans TaxID=1469910 RepID=A0A6A6ZFG5_9PLEO|nr:hypothetical protein CC86DRAFT_412911 [Ophiobolus disseminans]
MPTATAFHLFPDLPSELQVLIINHALRLELRARNNVLQIGVYISPKSKKIVLPSLPSIYQATRLSRTECMRLEPLTRVISHRRRGAHSLAIFNARRDNVEIIIREIGDSLSGDHYIHPMGLLSRAVATRVRHVVLVHDGKFYVALGNYMHDAMCSTTYLFLDSCELQCRGTCRTICDHCVKSTCFELRGNYKIKQTSWAATPLRVVYQGEIILHQRESDNVLEKKRRRRLLRL